MWYNSKIGCKGGILNERIQIYEKEKIQVHKEFEKRKQRGA